MDIYTSYFGNIKKLQATFPTTKFVSIAGYAPEGFADSKQTFEYKKLAPKYVWWKEWHDKFIEDLQSPESIEFYTNKYYETVLSKLSISEVIEDLKTISYSTDPMKIGDGCSVCLVCYETPNKFCHRHIVAKWLQDNGIDCKEIFAS